MPLFPLLDLLPEALVPQVVKDANDSVHLLPSVDEVKDVIQGAVEQGAKAVEEVKHAVQDVVAQGAKAVGLGQAPNVVPEGEKSTNDSPRKVQIAWHPVGGALGAYLQGPDRPQPLNASSPPDPTHHWAVLVGDYYHELNADSSLDVVYQNGKPEAAQQWRLYDVGMTCFNDAAIKEAGESAIRAMAKPYNIYNNNCQLFVIKLLDLICQAGRTKVTTSYTFISGTKAGVFGGNESQATEGEVAQPLTEEELKKVLNGAQALMNENTPLAK